MRFEKKLKIACVLYNTLARGVLFSAHKQTVHLPGSQPPGSPPGSHFFLPLVPLTSHRHSLLLILVRAPALPSRHFHFLVRHVTSGLHQSVHVLSLVLVSQPPAFQSAILPVRHFHPSPSPLSAFEWSRPRSARFSRCVAFPFPIRCRLTGLIIPFSLHLLTVFHPGPRYLALIRLAPCGASAGTSSIGPLLPVRWLSSPHSLPFHRTHLPVLPLIFPFSHQLVTVLPLGPRCLALVWFARCVIFSCSLFGAPPGLVHCSHDH